VPRVLNQLFDQRAPASGHGEHGIGNIADRIRAQ
jgi:hypothetical protein